MSSCISNYCTDSKSKEELSYNKTVISKFSTKGYSSVSRNIYVCLGSNKPHNGCVLGNSKDIFICQNDNSDKEISIFIELDKHILLSNILSCMPQDCRNVQIVFIFKEDDRDSHIICRKAQNSYQEYALKFFACKRNFVGVEAISINN